MFTLVFDITTTFLFVKIVGYASTIYHPGEEAALIIAIRALLQSSPKDDG